MSRPLSRFLQPLRRDWMRMVLLAVVCAFLTGCGSEVLYSDLSEAEANKVLGLLMARNIPASKQVMKENKFSVSVPREKFAEAVDLLEWYGIPSESYEGIGEVFQKSGMVSTPSEERIRYTYALGQGIAEMLSLIDGVVSARVQLVLPENDPYNNASTPSSASVFLKFRPGDVPTSLEPQVKRLVMNSVPDLEYDRVAVTVMQSDSLDLYFPVRNTPEDKKFLGFSVPATSEGPLTTLVVVLAVLVILGFGLAGYLFYRMRQKAKEKKPSDDEEDEEKVETHA